MIGIAIFLAGAALAYGVSKWLGIPATPFLILAGILLNLFALFPAELLQESLVLGLTFLLFVTGLELNPRRVRAQRRAAIRVGILQFFILGGIGTLAVWAVGADPLTAVYLGLALTASSTLVIVRLLQRRRQLFEPYGRMVVGVLLLQDVLVILLIPLLTHAPLGVAAVVRGFLGTVALVALAFVVLHWVTPRMVSLQHEEETLLLSVLAVLFVFVGIADLLNLPLAAGAFLAGVALSPFPVSGIVRGQLSSVADFFTAIFFLALGGLLTFPSPVGMAQVLVLSALVMVVTPPLVTLVAERVGFPARPAIEGGLVLSQTSELSLVVGLQALALDQIGQGTFTVLALVTVITMVLTPFWSSERVVRLFMRMHPLTGVSQLEARPSGHILLLGCGSGGLPILETLLAAGEEVVVIDDDPEVVDHLRRGDVLCLRGDASDPDVLRQAGADRARLVSSTIRRPRDNQGLLASTAGTPVLVRVFDDEDARWVEERGGIPILYSAAGAEEFLRWYDGEGRELTAARGPTSVSGEGRTDGSAPAVHGEVA